MKPIEELVIRNAAWISRTARRYYANPNDADDLASETIYKLLSQGNRYNKSLSFRPWALTIMENTFKSQYNHRKLILFTDYEYRDFIGNDFADQPASVRKLLSAIRRCRGKSCTVDSVLLYAKGYSYDEIAEMEGIPVGTVRSRISMGRRLLRDALA